MTTVRKSAPAPAVNEASDSQKAGERDSNNWKSDIVRPPKDTRVQTEVR
jgi:hypothetical protein